jgi:cell wall-associated NlpC family hydrolase
MRTGLLIALALAFTFGAAQATYQVKSGDTLEKIAKRYHCKADALARKNGIKDPSKLQIGQVLRLPTDPASYVNGKVPASVSASRASSSRAVAQPTSSSKIATISKSNVNVREKANTASRVVTRVDKGRTAKVLRVEGDWIKVQFSGGTTGFVRRDMVTISSGAKAVPAVQPTGRSGRTATIAKTDVNVREKPSPSSRVITKVDKGRTATILRTEGDWVKLQFPGGTTGFVHRSMLNLSAGDAGKPSQPKAAPTVTEPEPGAKALTITAQDANLRAGPSTRQPVVATLKQGTEAKVIGRQGEWIKVEFDGGMKGFIHASLTSLAEPGMTPPATNGYADLVEEAKRYLGVRYRYGGETSRGFDCSGFVYYLYKNVKGITLPRVSGAQASVGVSVDKSQLQPGDLVFFRTGRSSRINHAGIYIGNGHFIHASSGGGQVKIDSLTDGYYSKRYVTARRVVKK